MSDVIASFYKNHLSDGVIKDSILTAGCPFCKKKGIGSQYGKIIVFLNKSSFFRGYFRCSNHCIAGGFTAWFAVLMGIDAATVPGNGEDDFAWQNIEYPQQSINSEIGSFQTKLLSEQLEYYSEIGIGKQILQQLQIGYNGRYLVYPYEQANSNIYSARCVHPDKNDDYFWFGDEDFKGGPTGLFNMRDIRRCAGGALFLCEGEENLLTIKQLGFPGVAISDRQLLERLDPEVFSSIETLFVVMKNTDESESAARAAASRIGFKVRILKWHGSCGEGYSLRMLALESGKEFGRKVSKMILAATPFSPFPSPEREYRRFCTTMTDEAGLEYGSLLSGFPLLDSRVDGVHGINIIGGAPKVGKSCFVIQIATEMAARKIPILYYDFENGRQRIYQRTLARMSRIDTARLRKGDFQPEEEGRLDTVKGTFERMLHFFRVINDRKVSPEIMRRHIDFIRHETQREYPVVVIDSLHKLPFKDFSERRTGIDAWLRQMESIRDELQVSFLVISELSRGEDESYGGQPHMGMFKGSGDIEYSADNAMVLCPDWEHMQASMEERANKLWLVGSREHSPGLIGKYVLDYPYWGFREERC